MMRFLATLDLFKSNFVLRFRKDVKISTGLGLCFSLAIILILAFYASQSDVFYRHAPKVLDSCTGLDTRRTIDFDKKIFAVGVSDDNTNAGIVDPTLFTINVVNYFYNQDTGIGTEDHKTMHLCTEADFPENPQLYTALNLKNNFCIENSTFTLKGYWDEPEMDYMSLTLNLCDNETSNGTCQSYDQMLSQLKGKIFNLYYYDIVFDSSNQKTPLKKVVVNEWTFIDVRINKEAELFIQNLKTKTDDGLLFESWTYIDESQFVSKATDISFADDNDTSTARITFSFVAAKTERNIQRIFLKVSDLLANLGGISSTLMFIGSIFVVMEQKFLIKKTMLNTLFSFKIKKKKKSKINSKRPSQPQPNQYQNVLASEVKTERASITDQRDIIFTAKNIETTTFKEEQGKVESNKRCNFTKIDKKVLTEGMEDNPMQASENEFRNSEIKISGIQKSNSFESLALSPMRKKRPSVFSKKGESPKHRNTQDVLKFQEYKKKIIDNQDLGLNAYEYLFWRIKRKLFFWKKLKRNHEAAIFDESEKLFDENVDILGILKKLQEIEKLKNILLTPYQLKLFNFISKPVVYINDEEKSNKNFSKSKTLDIELGNSENEKDMVKDLLKHFEDLKAKGGLTEIDRRLLENLDKDVECFLEE